MERIIFHVDVNSAFLSWSALKLLASGCDVDLRQVHAAVGGDETMRHGVVLAKSVSAKKMGVRTGEPLFQARKKCPDLIVVPPDFDWYVKQSSALMEIMKDFTPDIEQYSIDEAFLDMTGMELVLGPWQESAAKLQRRVREELGFTVNIGVSDNRLLAKMASDFEKPDKIHTLFADEIARKMWPLPVGELFGVGKSAVKTLNSFGIYTIGDAARSDRMMLLKKMGSMGGMVWDYANGKESASLVRDTVKDNSYGNSVTTSRDIMSVDEAAPIILSLCETVAARLRADDKKGNVITVTLVDTEFRRRSHQMSLSYRTHTTDIIYETAMELLRQMWNGRPVRLIGVSAGKVVKEEFEQLSLFADERLEKLKKLDSALDAVRNRYGEQAVMRARHLEEGSRRSGLSDAKFRDKKNRNQEQSPVI